MDRVKRVWPFLAIIAAVSVIFSLLPLGTALQFGGDEGYELMKGFLVSKGFKLYKDIWNDQPPVYTLLLASAFKSWGPSILTARLIAGGFGLILFGTFFQLVNDRNGRWTALLATFFLLASPTVLELSVSVMKEVPTFAIALVSAILLFRWRKYRHWAWLISSAVVMGVALGIKCSAVMVAPAMLLEIVLTFKSQKDQPWLAQSLVTALKWILVTASVFGMINAFWAQGSMRSSWKAHFQDHAVSGLPAPADFPMPMGIFFEHAECTIAALLALLVIAKTKQYREFAFPIALLLTAAIVHTTYRPWWMYYYLHFAIPLAWLAGGVTNVALSKSRDLLSRSKFQLLSGKTWEATALYVTIALLMVRSGGRLENEVKELQRRETAKKSQMLIQMKLYAGSTHWVYTDVGQETYAFHAHLLTPPELAVVTFKRFWSDQISDREIVQICQRYKPEQVLLNSKTISSEWAPFLENYAAIDHEGQFILYVHKQHLDGK